MAGLYVVGGEPSEAAISHLTACSVLKSPPQSAAVPLSSMVLKVIEDHSLDSDNFFILSFYHTH